MKKASHPYARYEKEALWRAIDRGIRALVKNGDLTEQTTRAHIVGYLSKLLDEEGFKRVSELRTGNRTLRVVEVDRPSERAGAA